MTKIEQALNFKKVGIYGSILTILYIVASLYSEYRLNEALNEISEIGGGDVYTYKVNALYIIKASITSFLSSAFIFICGVKLKRQRGILNKFYDKFGRKKFVFIVLSVFEFGIFTTVCLVLTK